MIRTPILWAVVLLLVVALAIQLSQWNQAKQTEQRLQQTEITAIEHRYQKWQATVDAAKQRQAQLEAKLIYQEPQKLLPELTKMAQPLNVSLKAVQTPQKTHRLGYRAVPINMTFDGEYGGFAAFIEGVETLQPTPRIDYIRIYLRKRHEDLWLTLTLSMMTKQNQGQKIQTKKIEIVTIPQKPFHRFYAQGGETPRQDKETPLPQLIAVLWDKNKPVAILNHNGYIKTVTVEAVVDEVTVVNIKPQQVTVKRDGKNYHLPVWNREGIQFK